MKKLAYLIGGESFCLSFALMMGVVGYNADGLIDAFKWICYLLALGIVCLGIAFGIDFWTQE